MIEVGEPVGEHDPYHWIDTVDYLYRGNFRYGKGLVTMAAITEPESGRGRFRLGPLRYDREQKAWVLLGNDDQWKSYDRSWVMVNSHWHPQYRDDELLGDPVYAAKAAWEISGHGKTFSAWAAFNSKRHEDHMDTARFAVAMHAMLVLGKPKSEAARISLWKGTP